MKSPLLVVCVCLISAAVVNAQNNTRLKKVKSFEIVLPVLQTPEVLSPKDIANLAPQLDSVPNGTRKPASSAGKRNTPINGQIIGGSVVTVRTDYPWQVALFIDNVWFCGGSLIDGLWVMTAAHCASDFNVKGSYTVYAIAASNVNVTTMLFYRQPLVFNGRFFEIILGTKNIGTYDGSVMLINTTTKFVHKDYRAATITNDIALLKLPRDITTEFNSYINPVALPRQSDAIKTFENKVATISGWGKTSDAGGVVSALNAVNLTIAANTVCVKIYGKRSVLASQICCSTAGAHSTCNGDSGGPLVYPETATMWSQIGIVSYGSSAGCAAGYPVVFTRVSSFLGWISTTTGLAIRT